MDGFVQKAFLKKAREDTGFFLNAGLYQNLKQISIDNELAFPYFFISFFTLRLAPSFFQFIHLHMSPLFLLLCLFPLSSILPSLSFLCSASFLIFHFHSFLVPLFFFLYSISRFSFFLVFFFLSIFLFPLLHIFVFIFIFLFSSSPLCPHLYTDNHRHFCRRNRP